MSTLPVAPHSTGSVRIGRLAEGEVLESKSELLANTQCAVLDRRIDFLGSRDDVVPSHGAKQHELISGIEAQTPSGVDVQRHSAIVRIDRDSATWLQDREVEIGVGPNRDLHYQVDTTGRDAANLPYNVGFFVVDDLVRTIRVGQPRLHITANRGDDDGSRPARELDRGVAD
jgi:hypothetical protein